MRDGTLACEDAFLYFPWNSSRVAPHAIEKVAETHASEEVCARLYKQLDDYLSLVGPQFLIIKFEKYHPTMVVKVELVKAI